MRKTESKKAFVPVRPSLAFGLDFPLVLQTHSTDSGLIFGGGGGGTTIRMPTQD